MFLRPFSKGEGRGGIGGKRGGGEEKSVSPPSIAFVIRYNIQASSWMHHDLFGSSIWANKKAARE